MEWYYSLSLMVGLVCVLMLLGLPIAFTFFLANIVGAFLFLGGGSALSRSSPAQCLRLRISVSPRSRFFC